MVEARLGVADLGVGAGLRVPHYAHILSASPAVDFFEVISENYMVEGGKPLYHLDRVRERYPLVQHGVSLGIGSPGKPDRAYLERLKALHTRVQGPWVSDHFCWTSVPGVELHDLLPLPATEECLLLVAERARRVQDFLGVRLVLENASSYLMFKANEMPEWEFVRGVIEQANIGLLLDVNNVYVSAYNHGFDPFEYVNALPLERVVQLHIAGHTSFGTHLIDTHTGDITEPVWELYRYVIERAGAISTLVEWDTDVPEFGRLFDVVEQVKRVRAEALAARTARALLGLDARGPLRAGSVPRKAPRDRTGNPHRAWEQGGPRESLATDGSEVLA